MKILIVLVLALAGGWCAGYRVHAENLPYYLKTEDSNAKSQITLSNGSVLSGVIEEETEQTVKLNMDGAIMTYKKSEIESVKTGLPPDFMGMLRKNYEMNYEKRPLFTHRKEDSLSGKWDHAMLEPSRIADDIKKKNPRFSLTDAMSQDMAANAKAKQAAYKARQQAEQKEAAANGIQY